MTKNVSEEVISPIAYNFADLDDPWESIDGPGLILHDIRNQIYDMATRWKIFQDIVAQAQSRKNRSRDWVFPARERDRKVRTRIARCFATLTTQWDEYVREDAANSTKRRFPRQREMIDKLSIQLHNITVESLNDQYSVVSAMYFLKDLDRFLTLDSMWGKLHRTHDELKSAMISIEHLESVQLAHEMDAIEALDAMADANRRKAEFNTVDSSTDSTSSEELEKILETRHDCSTVTPSDGKEKSTDQ